MNNRFFKKVINGTVAMTAIILACGSLNAATAVVVSGAVRTAEVNSVDNETVVTGRLASTEYGGLAWSNHYHVTVIGVDGDALQHLVYRHGLKVPKAQSRQSSKPYRLKLEGVLAQDIAEIRFERVTRSHGFCS